MANKFRGEVDFEVGDRKFTLCCTLHALAEIQTELGLDGLAGILGKVLKISAPDMLVMLKALIRGGGQAISDEEFAALPLEPIPTLNAVGETFLGAKILPKEHVGLPGHSDGNQPNANEPTEAAKDVLQANAGETPAPEAGVVTDQADAKN